MRHSHCYILHFNWIYGGNKLKVLCVLLAAVLVWAHRYLTLSACGRGTGVCGRGTQTMKGNKFWFIDDAGQCLA